MAGNHKSGRNQYTPEVHAKIVEAVANGAFKTHAARCAGIHPKTLDNWLRLGGEGDAQYVQLYDDVHEAIANDALRNQTIINQAASSKGKVGDWKAAAWNLERKHPKLYGTAANIEAVRELERRARRRAGQGEKPFSPWKSPTFDGHAPRRYDA